MSKYTITQQDTVILQSRIDELLLSFDKLRKASGKERTIHFREVKSLSRRIYTFMHKLETADDKLKNR